ncbi:phage tail tube protein [Neorhizobium petrolearium]|uniref:phage tail tube protein n=1 Tax=Neorhizobium petrolearium TaxID=515361 RepID=UPI003F7E8D89
MTERYVDNLAILAKMETTYATDATPTGAANAMIGTNVSYEPFVGNDLTRDLIKPYMGHQGVIFDGNYCRLSMEIEIAGSGDPGTPPGCSPLLRSSGLAEVITADTDVQYHPVSKLFESCTIYFNDDGVNHIMLGCRGTVTGQLTPGQMPRFVFTMTGLLGTFSDTALPTIDDSKFIDPVPVNFENTTISLHGYAGACEGWSFDLANAIEPRLLINQRSIRQTGRQMVGQAIFEAALLAEKNWLQTMQSHTVGVMAAQHGTVAGNIVEFDAPKVQIGRLTYGATQGIRNNTLPLMYKPDAGNDEFVVTFR